MKKRMTFSLSVKRQQEVISIGQSVGHIHAALETKEGTETFLHLTVEDKHHKYGPLDNVSEGIAVLDNLLKPKMLWTKWLRPLAAIVIVLGISGGGYMLGSNQQDARHEVKNVVQSDLSTQALQMAMQELAKQDSVPPDMTPQQMPLAMTPSGSVSKSQEHQAGEPAQSWMR